MAEFFTSDLHFGHKNILKYTDRHKVVSYEDHDEWLIDTWNSQVKSNSDIVYHLGDFSFYSDLKKIERILGELRGKIVMIRGNHDTGDQWKLYNQYPDSITCYDYREVRIANQPKKSVLFHFPIEIWNQQHRGAWHLHGHCHGSFVKEKGYILDVGIDSAYNVYGQHKLFTVNDISEYMSKREMSGAVDHHDERD